MPLLGGSGPGDACDGIIAWHYDRGELDIPIARVYPLAAVREAYRELEQRHTLGKIALVP